MRCRAFVTFEYATRAPETHRTDVMEATGPQTIANRAIREAKKRIRPVYWTSMVCVLERLDSAEQAAAEDTAPETEDAADDDTEE
jgi:hypothetical protein